MNDVVLNQWHLNNSSNSRVTCTRDACTSEFVQHEISEIRVDRAPPCVTVQGKDACSVSGIGWTVQFKFSFVCVWWVGRWGKTGGRGFVCA